MITSKKQIEESRNAVSFLSEKQSLKNSDVLFFHGALAVDSLDELDKPSILMNHGAQRQNSFLYDEFYELRNPTEQAVLDKEICQIRDTIRELMEKPDVVLSNSHFIKEKTKQFYGIDTEVVYPPIDRDKFRPVSENRQDYFLSVQRLDWAKRVESQIKAFAGTDKKLNIAGTGRLEKEVRSLADRHENIDYLGYIPDDELVRRMSEAQAVIQTGMKEDYGLVPREAMACGTPVIVGNEGGFKEMVTSREHGIKFDPNNRINSLRDAVYTVKNEEYDRDIIRKMTEKYSFDVIQRKLRDKVEKAVRVHEEAK